MRYLLLLLSLGTLACSDPVGIDTPAHCAIGSTFLLDNVHRIAHSVCYGKAPGDLTTITVVRW